MTFLNKFNQYWVLMSSYIDPVFKINKCDSRFDLETVFKYLEFVSVLSIFFILNILIMYFGSASFPKRQLKLTSISF